MFFHYKKLYVIFLTNLLCTVITISCCPKTCRCSNASMYCLYKGIKTDELIKMAPSIPSTTTKIYLTGNELDTLPSQHLTHLKNLQYLALSFNKLETLPQNISKYFPKLKELYLTANQIGELSSLSGYENIVTLNLDQNRIKEVPPFIFKGLVALKDLLLGKNMIKKISKHSFTGLSSLQKLQLNNNRMQIIHEMAFHSTQKLREIYLHVNELTIIRDKLFRHLNELSTLYLYDNKIGHVGPKAFQNLNMNVLYLSSNKLKVIPTSSFNNINIKKRIYMHDNLFQCDCQLIMSLKAPSTTKKLYDEGKITLGQCYSEKTSSFNTIANLRLQEFNCNACDLKPCNEFYKCTADATDTLRYQCLPPLTTNSYQSTKKVSESKTEELQTTAIAVGEQKSKNIDSDQGSSSKTVTWVVALVCALTACILTVLGGWFYWQRRKRREFKVSEKDRCYYGDGNLADNTYTSIDSSIFEIPINL